MKKEVALRIKAGLEGTPLAMAFKMSGDQTPVEFPRRWKPAVMDVADLDRCIEDVRHGRVRTIDDIARTLQCPYQIALRIFETELGVIRLGAGFRVPENVFQKVLHQIMTADTNEEKS